MSTLRRYPVHLGLFALLVAGVVSAAGWVWGAREPVFEPGESVVAKSPASDSVVRATFLRYESVGPDRYVVCQTPDGRTVRLMPRFVSKAN